MSRSYKKHPYCTDGSNGKTALPSKTIANRHYRRMFKARLIDADNAEDYDDISSSRAKGIYKKTYCQWDICDFKFRETKEEAIAAWEQEEVEYPKDIVYVTYVPDETQEPIDQYEIVSLEDGYTLKTIYRYPYIKKVRIEHEEEGYLHKKYGTLKKYLSHWEKTYLRK